jgi:hypothetical protein
MRTARNRGGIGLAIALIALAIVAATAYAASTRAEYVAQVDPICQAAHIKGKAAAHSFKARIRQLRNRGIDPEGKAGIRAAVQFYGRVVRVERSAINEIARVPPAPGDEELISQWLRKLTQVDVRLQHFIRLLPQGEERKARRAISRAFEAGFRADNLVQDFGFKYCGGS